MPRKFFVYHFCCLSWNFHNSYTHFPSATCWLENTQIGFADFVKIKLLTKKKKLEKKRAAQRIEIVKITVGNCVKIFVKSELKKRDYTQKTSIFVEGKKKPWTKNNLLVPREPKNAFPIKFDLKAHNSIDLLNIFHVRANATKDGCFSCSIAHRRHHFGRRCTF